MKSFKSRAPRQALHCVLLSAAMSVLFSAATHAQQDASATNNPVPAPPEKLDGQKLDTISVGEKDKSKKAPERDAPTQLNSVTVTGSHVKRADTETAQPVTTITRKDLDRTGITTIGDILQTLPSAGSALNTTFNNGGTGATEIDLRNLGSKRVLVLVDGHRWISGLSSLSTSSVDLNTIPLAIIERVDILQDGASAAYGSDAITGVVNIITKKHVNGINLSTQVGAFTEGDGAQQLHTLSAGHSFPSFFGGRTSFLGSFSFQDQRAVFAGDRDISRLPKINTGLTRGSSFLPEGRDLFVANQQTAGSQNAAMNGRCPSLVGGVAQGVVDGNYPPTTIDPGNGLPPVTPPSAPPGTYPPIGVPGQLGQLPAGVNLCDLTHVTGANQDSATQDFRQRVAPTDSYNYALTNYLSTPLRTYNGFAAINHEFNDRNYLSFEFLHSDRKSKQQLAPSPICVGNICPVIGGFPVNADGSYSQISYNQASYIGRNNPYNPFGQDIGRIDPTDPTNMGCDPSQVNGGSNCNVGLIGQGAVLRRIVEGDPRVQEQHVPTQLGRAAYNGGFDVLDLPIDFEFGYSYGQSRETNRLSGLINMARLQLSLAEGDCTAPCVPVNLLGGPGTLTPEMLNYILYNDYSSTKQKQSDLYFNISTSIPLGKWLPGGPLGVAFGVERRTSHYSFLPSIEAITNVTSGLTALPTDGAETAKEAFAELNVPIVKELPFVYALELDLAGRSSSYGRFGSSNDGKVGLKYRPYRDLLLRGTFSTSFRAPDVGELYLGNAGSYPGLVDPCVGSNGRRMTGNNIDKNCNSEGIAAGTTQPTAQILSPFGGNPNLRPEDSHSTSFGFVFSPDQISGLDLSVDYFKIILNNFITAPGGQYILDSCYANDPNNRSFCGSQYIQRAPNGTLNQVFNIFSNFPQTDTSGFDYALNWALPTKSVPLLAPLGKFKLVAGATFLSSYNQITSNGMGGQFKQGLTNTMNLPRWKINPSLQWSLGNFEASWNTRIIWHQLESCDDGLTPSLKDLGLCSDPNHLAPDGTPAPLNQIKLAAKHDIQLAYGIRRYKTKLVFGIQNVLDNDPPISYSAFANSFDPMYWVPGVLPYASVKKDF